ncbi:MAG: transcriptional regulator, Crp/Fnr family [Ramlibacter sp.]|jgi:CRP/FNR family transcriptional regulator|nr:transcriptional regulator, Crp/Fnr family [Ramlibacter sp.]MDB5912745.1 transcriptional regulator, Crp/Fnr family [Ramlibacter sp.]
MPAMQTAPTALVPAVRFIPIAQAVATGPNTHCSKCHLKDLCLPRGLDSADVRRLDTLMFAQRRLKEGQALYHEGEGFHFLYAVRSGTFKSVVSSRDGREQVTSFHMAGEMMGLDGLAHGKHASGSIALEDAEVCAIPYVQLATLAARSAELQQVVSRLMSREIVREHGLMMLLGGMSAEERLAAFLLNLSRRLQARGYSPSEFHLRMSRAEIGSYLGMTLETVSRTFSAFQQQRLLEVDKKHVRIVDLEGLERAFAGKLQ